MKKKYAWTPPIYHVGEIVHFKWSEKIWKTGIIRSLETRYDHKGMAYHSYRVLPEGGIHGRWVNEQSMRIVKDEY